MLIFSSDRGVNLCDTLLQMDKHILFSTIIIMTVMTPLDIVGVVQGASQRTVGERVGVL